jgi:hypothetical protein
MNRKILLFSLFLVSSRAQGFDSALSVPEGWNLLENGEAKGDLNQDGRDDWALVVEEVHPKMDPQSPSIIEVHPRALLIYLAKKDGSYDLHTVAKKAIFLADQGGELGDPFQGISIKKQILIVDYYGGSGWRWTLTHKFRYQKNEFYLTGSRYTSFSATEPNDEKVIDTNYSTGIMEITEFKKKTKKKLTPNPKLPLRDFDVSLFNE